MLVLDDYYLYDLDDINKESNIELKNSIMELRNYELAGLYNNPLARRIINDNNTKSIIDIMRMIDEAEMKYRSEILFPGDIVLFYPQYHEYRTTRPITCDVSGARIKIGSLYCYYQAFISNITNGKKYVLKRPIKTEIGYQDFLPYDINTFEQLDVMLQTSYNTQNDEYDYYAISQRIGEGLYLRELKKLTPEKRKIKRQLKKYRRI